jgi:orotate phosphoribosyltransferase/AMMECR1 domain-containing protein
MNNNRHALATHLRERGILYASPTQPIRQRDGTPAPWAFYSWNVTLTSEGLRLAALCILERLRSFHATQLATIGYTGMPLLSACVLLGEGRYTGLCIREQRKTSVSCRRVEGTFDKTKPVVIIDDSISSGTSLGKAIRAIEDEGAEVEGTIALVQFPHRGGLDRANAAGYRAEAILDIWSDLGMGRTLARPPPRLTVPAGTVPAQEGLSPASLARFTAATFLRTGAAPKPPCTMDRAHQCPGGVFVSFRERHNENRIARAGFWHFDPARARPCDDVVAATIETLHAAHGQISAHNLAQLKIAVTFLSELEPIAPRGLDFDRYGIVAQSRVFPHKRGGALPNTQVFISEIEQYRQARETNAGIVPGEPHDLFRHDVTKHVEPGETWLPYGTPENALTAWWRDEALGRRITARARGLLARELSNDSDEPPGLPNDTLPSAIAGVAVRLYEFGLTGYGLALGGDLDAGLRQAVAQAVADPRFKRDFDQVCGAIVVSIIHHPESLGAAPIAAVARKLRRGLDALGVTHAGRTTILLPHVLPYNNLSRDEFVRTALRQAGAETATDRVEWRTFQCAEWVDAGGQVHALRFGFPDRTTGGERGVDATALIRLLGGYIARSIGVDGLPRYLLLPIAGKGQAHGTAARAIYSLMALDLAGALLDETAWRDAAAAGLRHCLGHVRQGTIMLPNCVGGTLADAALLGAAAGLPVLAASAEARSIQRRLRRLLRPDGRIGNELKRLDQPEDHDFLPGALLAALGRVAAIDPPALPTAVGAQIAWYAHRFAAYPSWGSAGWLPQGMAAVHRITADPTAAQLAFAATDWSIERQLASTGAFLEDLSPDEPSFNTGFIAEGVAASWAIALRIGDTERAARYAASWRDAMKFITRLTVFPEDVFAMRAGSAAVGGVRCMQSRSDIRIDQVSHCLHALVAGARLEHLMDPSATRCFHST